MTNDVRQLIEEVWWAGIDGAGLDNMTQRIDARVKCVEAAVLKLTAQPAPSGWQQRIAAMAHEISEGVAKLFDGDLSGGMRVEAIALRILRQNAVDAGQPAKDAQLPAGALEAAFREGYDFGQADAGWKVVDADDAWRKSGTGQPAKGVTCPARRGKTDPPQDCDWPFCGCDEHATKVIATLQECGWGPR